MTSSAADDKDPPKEDKESTEQPEETKEATSTENGEPKSTEDALKEGPQPNVSADDDVRPSDASQPSDKKRRSNIQLNKDDHPEGECASGEDGDLNDEGGKRSDPFKRASEDVIKGRKIVKASKKWGGGSASGGGGGGVFGSVNLVASKPAAEANGESKEGEASSAPASGSVFGSTAKVPSFGSAAAGKSTFGSGFGAVSNGFGSIKAAASPEEDKSEKDSPPKTFGQGFGSVSTGFGSVKSADSGFGKAEAESTATAESLSGAFASSTSSTAKFVIQAPVSLANGEEDEDCVYEVRAKLFKLAPVTTDQENEEDETKGEFVPSVPSTAGRMELKKGVDEKKEETNNGSADSKDDTLKMDWHEGGIGPVRILKRKVNPFNTTEKTEGTDDAKPTTNARVVQRRETAPGGQGTKLILNVRLLSGVCHVHRKSEQCIQLDAPNSDGDGSGRALGSYLFRVKTTAEADSLQNSLEKMLEP